GRLSEATRAALLDHITVTDVPPITGIAKSVFSGNDLGMYEAVSERLGERFHVITGTMPGLGTAGGEVSPAGVTKGSTLLMLLASFNTERTASIALADNNSDREMLSAAGTASALGNATEQALAAADEVTASVDADGIWNAFQRHGLV